jgi:hypothetical protein
MQAKVFLAALMGFALAACASAPPADAQPSSGPTEARAQIMVLGVYHFTPGGSDYVENRVDDHLSPTRQAEIADVLDRLERFRPTTIVLEYEPQYDERFNARYRAYRNGEAELTVNERDQLGMALARRLGHERIYGVDFASDMDFPGMLAAAEAAGQTHLLEQFQAFTAEIERRQAIEAQGTVRERLITQNSPDSLAIHNGYMVMAQMGTRDDPIGAREMQAWWGRNMVIYARTAQLAEPGDRILLIYGAGHKFLLDQYIRQTPDLELVDPLDYLR